MYAANASNTVRTIITTARQVGAELPAELVAQVDHLAKLETDPRDLPTPATIAADLARHLGKPAAMTKARAQAAADLAAAEAHAKITGALVDRCAIVVQQRLIQDRETVTAAFAPPLAATLATPTETAPRLPLGFTAAQAAGLDAATFEAWIRARDAHAQIEAVSLATAPLFRTAPSEVLTREALAALRYTAPPQEFTDTTHAHRFARALTGTRHGGSTVGPVNVQGVFAPTACAELGGTFAWATPAEVARRAEAITAGATPPVVTRGRRQAPVGISV
jgi:hypothetical protein